MPKNVVRPKLTLELERALARDGATSIAGVDEVGVGAIAGPLIAVAVILPLDSDLETTLDGLRDSNQIHRRDRARLLAAVRRVVGPNFGVGIVRVAELAELRNQSHATRLATVRAVQSLPRLPDVVFLDGLIGDFTETLPMPTQHVPKMFYGTSSLTIAAASLLASETHRRIMAGYDRRYPGYGFARHTGNISPQHLAALADLGPSPIHHTWHRVLQARATAPS